MISRDPRPARPPPPRRARVVLPGGHRGDGGHGGGPAQVPLPVLAVPQEQQQLHHQEDLLGHGEPEQQLPLQEDLGPALSRLL